MNKLQYFMEYELCLNYRYLSIFLVDSYANIINMFVTLWKNNKIMRTNVLFKIQIRDKLLEFKNIIESVMPSRQFLINILEQLISLPK